MPRRRMVLLAAALVLGACSGCSRKESVAPREPSAPPAFWVWHRGSDLTENECRSLRQAGVDRLYWQAAECEWRGGRWHSTGIARGLADHDGITVVPVFRIKPRAEFLGDPEAAPSLARQIRAWWNRSAPMEEIQFDFDCPARVLTGYARFLTEMKRLLAPAGISSTALASWPEAPGFGLLARSVDSLVPMFYDLEGDTAGDVLAGRFKLLADAAAIRWIGLWRECPVPWYAGLPNFERVSVFHADGALSGHLRGWDHDMVFFRSGLSGRAAGPGVVEFGVGSPVTLAGTRVEPGQRVVWRTTDGEGLECLTTAAADAGARGVVYFALPGPGLQAAYSPGHLTARSGAATGLVVRRGGDGAVILENRGPRDLPARANDPDSPGGRGWALILEAPARSAFREASPGEFCRVETGGGYPAAETTSLVLRFSRLPAGMAIRSGPCVAQPAGIRWRIGAHGEAAALE